jgi:hypothetical protein
MQLGCSNRGPDRDRGHGVYTWLSEDQAQGAEDGEGPCPGRRIDGGPDPGAAEPEAAARWA